MKKTTMTEKRFFEWHEDDKSVTLRASGGSYGGGTEVLVIYSIQEKSVLSVPQTTNGYNKNKSCRGN